MHRASEEISTWSGVMVRKAGAGCTFSPSINLNVGRGCRKGGVRFCTLSTVNQE